MFDDTALDIVLGTLDTVADFTAYLRKKEALLRSSLRVFAAGEEELLAHYLVHMDQDGTHGFSIPQGYGWVWIDEGEWERFTRSPKRQAQKAADEVSYTWDRLIETFNRHILAGTYHYATDPAPRVREGIVRFLAAEPRFRRRVLSKALVGQIESYPRGKKDIKSTRVIPPRVEGDPYYLFLVFGRPSYVELQEEYREGRRKLLEFYCRAVKHKFPDALDVIGIATEPGKVGSRSEDAVWLNARDWTPELQNEAAALRRDLNLLNETKTTSFHEKEYPDASGMPKNPRNKPCFCGSTRKFKHCHGRA